MLIDPWTVNRSCHSRLRPSHLLAKAEKQSKLVGHGADAVACPALLAQLNEESVHISDLEIREPLDTDVLEKLRYALSNGCDRSGRKAALHFAITTESVDFLLVGSRNMIRFPQSAGETKPVACGLSKLLVGLLRTAATRIAIGTMSPSFCRALDLFALHWA